MTGSTPSTRTRRDKLLVPIDIGSGRTTNVVVTGDQADYFNITGAVSTSDDDGTAITPRQRERAAHTRSVYSSVTDATPREITVGRSIWYDTPTASTRFTQGKAIKVPTAMTTTRGNVRFTTIHMPAAATNLAIARWINTKFTAHKPSYFLTPAGARHPVNVAAPPGADVNPGNDDDATPTP